MVQGILCVRIQGASPELFFTVCAQDGVVFHNIQRHADGEYTAEIFSADHVRMRHAARIAGCTVHVLQKSGIPFLAAGILRRKILLIGAVLFAACVFWLAGRVWYIHIEGCESVSQKELLEALAEAGLKTGVRRSRLPMNSIKTDVIIRIDKLSHLTINFRGVGAYVHVWERKDTPIALDESTPCDVISDKTGVILRLRVRTGVSKVKIGDTIQPGDMISEGTVVSTQGKVTLLHALAEADVRTWYTLRAAIPKETLVGSAQPGIPSYSMILGSRRFPLQRIENAVDPWYDKHIEKEYLRPHPDFRWPIALEKTYCSNIREQPQPISPDMAEALLQQRMLSRILLAHPDAELVNWSFERKESAGAYIGVLRVEMIETTGKEVPIVR